MPTEECYLEYVWVSPSHRRSNVASDLVASVLGVLRQKRYRIAYLWVLDGNEAAMGLYKKLGFVSTDDRNPVEGRPGRYEERMKLELEPQATLS